MSRLDVVSWMASATVHAGTLALLGALLTSVPIQQAEIAGSRVVVSSSFAVPTPVFIRTETESVELTPDEPVKLPDPTRSTAAVSAVHSIPEVTVEAPPTAPPKPMSLEQLQKIAAKSPMVLREPAAAVPRRTPTLVVPGPDTKETSPSPTGVAEPTTEQIANRRTEQKPKLDVKPAEPPEMERAQRPVRPAELAKVDQPTPKAAEPPTPKAIPQTAGTTETRPARPLNNPNPVYPPDAVRQRLEGVVLLRVTISASGKVSRANVFESSGHRQLDEAARVAVSRWEFAPASRDGQPVEWTARLPVRFRL
jgi:periplasmic protein TonB